MGRKRREVSAEVALRAALVAAEYLGRSQEFGRCVRLVLYAALADEFPTRPIYEQGREAGVELLWPRMTPGGALEFAVCALWEDLRPGRYGVFSPPEEAVSCTLRAGDLVLAPGMAFDRAGQRLGRGGGHYDRALSGRAPGTVVFGVGFEFQRIDEVPVGPGDQPVDAVLTESGVWRSAPR
jgi:5-formyltetrahydrofolate cyclo-ligase